MSSLSLLLMLLLLPLLLSLFKPVTAEIVADVGDVSDHMLTLVRGGFLVKLAVCYDSRVWIRCLLVLMCSVSVVVCVVFFSGRC